VDGDRLSSADQSALAFEAPESPMHVVAILWLESVPPFSAGDDAAVDALRRHVDGRLDRAPRLRQVVRGESGLLGRARWVESEAFDIAAHIAGMRTAAPGSDPQLMEQAARFFMEPLDRDRPLWRIRLVFGLADGRIAMLVKIHHAIADGPAAVRLLAALFDTPPAVPPPAPPQPGVRAVAGSRGRVASVLAAARGYARTIAAMSRAPVTSINRPVGPERRLAILRVPVAEVKAVAHASGAKVNDVFVTLAAVGARELLVRHGDAANVDTIVAGVFVGLRTERTELGNETGVIAVPLPLGERDPRRMLALVAASIGAAKAEQPAAGISAITYVVTRAGLGRALYRRQRQVNIFTTNVVGPPARLSLLGASVCDIAAVTSLAGNVGLSFAALSYAGQLDITIIGDADTCPEVDAAAEAMRRSWEMLRGQSV
jgi:diacylglycerol O-acyltransferase